ncbi:dioxygenase [Paenibacillus albiflavus]|uniref:Dioxygenase n=1 Tax=Paenibacillus albiflavus TaxID=2545760 RepID=A0A4R4EJM5_9BACL|nr:class III extradiol ring-cleavage dioxygenase [Paenibacillus albiflavus]TCZ78455.1 dioxygenase [Paenibacillus albiflavus]
MSYSSMFVAHGSPMLAVEDTAYTRYLEQLYGTKADKPEAIVIFSAHWESGVQLVSTGEQHEMIYDFYGFPDELYQIQYPAKGNPALAEEILQLFANEGIMAQGDSKRGLDHGAWSPLVKMFPKADIPVVALSVNPRLTAEEHYRIGKALAPLRERNVLIIGSGGTVHNLRRVNWGAKQPDSWAIAFDEWLSETLETWNTSALFEYEEQAPYAREAVPTTEHFVPIILAMGAADQGGQAQKLHQSYQYGSLSLCVWRFE